MSGTETADGDIELETELAAEVSDNSSPRELIERASKLLDGMTTGNAYADVALQHCKSAVDWLRKGGM